MVTCVSTYMPMTSIVSVYLHLLTGYDNDFAFAHTCMIYIVPYTALGHKHD